MLDHLFLLSNIYKLSYLIFNSTFDNAFSPKNISEKPITF
ncbi:hypothetical protein WANG_0553 [Lactobacillus kefiranofaciens subsp. kefiranofaciens]|nr:hypothetical protein WANG_0553 [Lactobacillus kefiranofaciens subsp. kefiranofaciens]